ncbi:MAG: hypothetical protein C0592_00750 [Marinilabiliales bacterium]|nr:MAG: hypothetical protein C0592_00750 [Marinilabiliales bacterium]
MAFANAQDFGYENKLKNDAVTVDQKKELLTLIVSNCLYNGDMQFLVQEKDLQPLAENYTVEAKSMQDLVDHYMQDLAEAETKYDSVEIYQGLKGVYLSMLKFDEAQNTLQFIYNSLDVLLNDTELDSVELAGVYRMAGNYMYEYGQDKASSYPYFTQAIMFDPTDTSSYIFIMLLYTQFGGFDQADSIAQALEQKFPDAFSPYILHTQSVASRMYMENADSVDNLITKCLTDLADLSYLDHLKDAGKGSRQELLYYLMLENMVLLKYYSVLGSDETAEILDCDMNILKDIRRVCLTHDHESTRVPKYTTLNAVAWTYAIDHEFDSSLFYLNKALVEVKKLDAGYSTVTHNIMSSIMAFTFLQGDTLGALKKLEDKLAYSDTIGYLLTDIALLSRLYAMTGDFQNSHKYADFVLNYNPNFYPAWRIKAYADFEAGQPDSVFTYMDKAMQIGKQDFETYLMYGLLYLMQDKPVLAYTYLEAAWYVDPESSILEDVMSELYVRKEE